MHSLGIHTGADLKQWSERQLVERFGKVGHFYYKVTRGEDDRPVNPDRLRQSIGVEQSFVEDLLSLEAMGIELEKLAHKIKLRSDQHQQVGQTLTLKIKYSNYRQITRSRTVSKGLQNATEIFSLAKELLLTHLEDRKTVRLLGITISKLEDILSKARYEQLCLIQ